MSGRTAASEHAIQAAYFDWARLHPEARRAFAVPNGGHRHVAVAAKLRAEGVRKGVLDVMLPVARGGSHGLWIEFKAGYNLMTPEQAQEADDLVAGGYTVVLSNNTEKAIEQTLLYLASDLPPALVIALVRRRAQTPAAPSR